MSKHTPIIGREALLSLIEWGQKMRRQQDERSLSGDFGIQEGHSGGTQTSHHGAVSPDDSSASHRIQHQQGEHDEEGA